VRWVQEKRLSRSRLAGAARGIRWAGVLLGCLSRRWISIGAHVVWVMTWTHVHVLLLSLRLRLPHLPLRACRMR
jgi:hypothetical protein